MKTKVLSAFLFLFFIQFLSSCIRCGESIAMEIDYEGISITPWDTSGFGAKEVTDSVYRNSFGLSVSLVFEPKQVSYNFPVFGFSQSVALSCPEPEYKYNDPIDYMEIFVMDIETNEEIEVTSRFATESYDGELISLDELFEIREEWHDGFQLELIEFESVPSTAVFTVNVYLQSGKKFTEETEQINFID